MKCTLRFTKRVCAIVTLAALCGLNAPARASAAGPIEINGCSPVFDTVENSPYAVGLQVQTGVEVRFVNHSNVAVRQVAFRLGDGPDAPLVVDRGTFAPGVTIRTVFETTQRTGSVCRVATVRFTDDTAAGVTADG